MKPNNSKMLKAEMPEGLNLDISHHPLTMKSVVNLIIALDRLKGSSSSSSSSESLLSTEVNDENLLNIMIDTVVEGKCRGQFHQRFQQQFCHNKLVFNLKLKDKMIRYPQSKLCWSATQLHPHKTSTTEAERSAAAWPTARRGASSGSQIAWSCTQSCFREAPNVAKVTKTFFWS